MIYKFDGMKHAGIISPKTEEINKTIQTGHPSGTVTFLFTDIQGFMPLWERAPQ